MPSILTMRRASPRSVIYVIIEWIEALSLHVQIMCAWHTASILETRRKSSGKRSGEDRLTIT
jgi:hypothetical protein